MFSEDLDDMINENGTCTDCEIHYSDEDKLTHYASEEEKAELNATSKWALKGRFRSWALWLGVAGLISVVFTAFNLWERIGITSETFDGIVSAIGTVLIGFGILNNPTDKEGF